MKLQDLYETTPLIKGGGGYFTDFFLEAEPRGQYFHHFQKGDDIDFLGSG